jgi:hypothetical protein
VFFEDGHPASFCGGSQSSIAAGRTCPYNYYLEIAHNLLLPSNILLDLTIIHADKDGCNEVEALNEDRVGLFAFSVFASSI